MSASKITTEKMKCEDKLNGYDILTAILLHFDIVYNIQNVVMAG